MRRELMNRDNKMKKAKLRFLDKRLIGLVAALSLSTPLMAQDVTEKVADEAIKKELQPVDSEKLKKIEEILKQQSELAGDTLVLEGDELMKHRRFEKASDKYTAAKVKYEKVSKSEPSVLKKIAEVEKKHSLTLRLYADQLVKEAVENADENSSSAFDKALGKLGQAKLLDPSRTLEIDSQIKIVREKVAVFEHTEKVGRRELLEAFEFDPQKGSITNGIHFQRAKILYADRRFGESKILLERILTNQPFNEEAVNLLLRVNKKVHAAAKERRKTIIQEYLDEVEWKWSDPINAYTNETVIKAPTKTVNNENVLGNIYKKLKIVIPKVRFEDRDLEFVVDFIKRTTRDLDDEGEGLNVIVSVDNGAGAPAPEAAAPEPDAFGDEPAADGLGDAAAPAGGGGRVINLDADDMPVGEVIKYICDQLGLKYKVEEFAVIIGDNAKFQDLETKFYSISAGLLEIVESKSGAGIDGGLGGLGGIDAGGGDGGPDFQGYFQKLGITFPPGAKIKFVQTAMRLVVTNIPENQDKLQEILRQIGIETPQVSIESKFIEINNTNTKELGVSWDIGRPNHIFNPALGTNNGPNGINHQILLNDPNFANVANANLGNGSLSSGIRNIATLAGATSSPVQAGINVILGDFIFQGLIRALEQESTNDILSAPQVTAVSGKTAVVRVVTERFFPESWDQPDISAAFVFGSSPQFGEPRDVGIVFEVTPQVEPDGYTISLDLKPQVLQFVRYDTSYNSVINLPAVFGGGVLPVIYQMPILSARTIETRVTIWDGETIMLGGLVTENVIAVDDKVPYLGDIPFMGRLFQNKGQQNVKQNLLVFVTAKLIDPSGLPKKPNLNRGLPDFKRL
jgi:tetratricopeptide (TPR) repeat protein